MWKDPADSGKGQQVPDVDIADLSTDAEDDEEALENLPHDELLKRIDEVAEIQFGGDGTSKVTDNSQAATAKPAGTRSGLMGSLNARSDLPDGAPGDQWGAAAS